MTTLLLYTSRHGTTEKVANYISKHLLEEVKTVDLIKEESPSIYLYQTIIIGTSIHMGGIPRKMTQFLEKNERLILSKRLGIFLCCMKDGQEAQLQFESSFSSPIRGHVITQALCGGEFIFSKMNFLEREIIHKIVNEKDNRSTISQSKIDKFIKELNNNTQKTRKN